jgi:cytoskeletal protein RodZ
MDMTLWLVLLVVVVLAVAVGVWTFTRQRQKREELREQFGPEYQRTVERHDSRSDAERELAQRSERVEQLHIRPLAPDRSAHYAEQWRVVQADFVDDPERAIGTADSLIAEVLQARGYPMGDFEQRAADISVEHAGVVEHYRAAHAVAVRVPRGEATTEDMREAMLHYRTLFDDVIDTRDSMPKEERRDSAA